MRKRLRKRYQSPKEIIDQIDKARAQVNVLNELAEANDRQIARNTDTVWDQARTESLRLGAEAYRTEAARIEKEKLGRLKEALAELQTQTFSFESDSSVPVISWKDKVF